MSDGLDRSWLRNPGEQLARNSCASEKAGWQEQEDTLTELVPGGKLVPGSGSSSRSTRRGDVDGRLWLAEGKTTGKDSIRLQRSWLQKIRIDADARGKLPLLAVGFDANRHASREDWVAIPAGLAKSVFGVLDAVMSKDFEAASRLAREVRQ